MNPDNGCLTDRWFGWKTLSVAAMDNMSVISQHTSLVSLRRQLSCPKRFFFKEDLPMKATTWTRFICPCSLLLALGLSSLCVTHLSRSIQDEVAAHDKASDAARWLTTLQSKLTQARKQASEDMKQDHTETMRTRNPEKKDKSRKKSRKSKKDKKEKKRKSSNSGSSDEACMGGL